MSDPLPTPPAPATPAAAAVAAVAPAPAPAPAALVPAASPAPAGDPPPAIPQWLNSMPDDLRNDPDINRYGSVEDLAKGLKETRAWARGRIPIPTDEAGFKELGEKLRPESADKYDITVPPGADPALAEAARAHFFDIGLPPQWAKAVVDFNNQFAADQASQLIQKNQDGLKAIELEMGAAAYNTRLEAVANMFARAGIEGFDAVQALEQVQGAEPAMRAFFRLAEATGELGKVDGALVEMRMGSMTAAQAQAEIDRMFSEDVGKNKLRDKTSPEYKKYEQLLAIQARGA